MTSKNKSLIISAHRACGRHMFAIETIFSLVEQLNTPFKKRLQEELKSLARSNFQQKQEIEVLVVNTSKSISWH